MFGWISPFAFRLALLTALPRRGFAALPELAGTDAFGRCCAPLDDAGHTLLVNQLSWSRLHQNIKVG